MIKRFITNYPQTNPTFIGSWMIEKALLCENLIDYFETHQQKQNPGISAGGMNTNLKDSTDISILPKEINYSGNEVFKTYFKQLFNCYEDYIEQWPFLEKIGGNVQIGSFNLQRYKPGQHFKKIHTERFNIETLHRIFAFMTYLNDVEEGGSTFFSHYDLEIQPKKGLTLIWPAEWTHAHKGNVIESGAKYIITGWMNFY